MSKNIWVNKGVLCLMLTSMISLKTNIVSVMKFQTLILSALMAITAKPTLAAEIKTNDELALWVCETRTEQDCKDAKNFMKVIESRKPAQRMRKQLSGTAALVGEVQVHYSKKTKVIYVQYEDTGSSTYEKAQTTYTRTSAFGSWKKSE